MKVFCVTAIGAAFGISAVTLDSSTDEARVDGETGAPSPALVAWLVVEGTDRSGCDLETADSADLTGDGGEYDKMSRAAGEGSDVNEGGAAGSMLAAREEVVNSSSLRE